MNWKPIDDDAKDGRSWALWCPDESPSLVVGFFYSQWERWLCADEDLRDLRMGGIEPTHYAPIEAPEDEAYEMRKDNFVNVKQLERDNPWGWGPVPDFRLRESSDGKVTLQRRWEHVCGVSAWRDIETIVVDTPLPPSKEESK